MYTKVKMLNGKEHVINGRPQDLLQIVDGMGVMPGGLMLISRDGEQVDMKDVVTMEEVNK